MILKKLCILFLSLFVLFSCKTDEQPYSYLCDADSGAEMVDLVYSVSDSQTDFEYTFQAREMCIGWGDTTKQGDYLFVGNNDSIKNIKPLSHTFISSGEYSIKVKALQLEALQLSKIANNDITKLELTACDKLLRLYCEDQPIPEIDISNCPLLEELSCGFSEGNQSIVGLELASKLRYLSINGPLGENNLNLSINDSLSVVSFKNTNLTTIQLTSLKALSSVEVDNCQNLENLYLSDNTRLTQLVITNNPLLNADKLNEIFTSLPQVSGGERVIVLNGNAGDDNCNRTIATNKGWIFR